jgi:hypothetical protein
MERKNKKKERKNKKIEGTPAQHASLIVVT